MRRFVAVALRSLIHGDVPLGTFWVGWTETRWTPSGFEGWTTGKKPRSILAPMTAAAITPRTALPSAAAPPPVAQDLAPPVAEPRHATPILTSLPGGASADVVPLRSAPSSTKRAA